MLFMPGHVPISVSVNVDPANAPSSSAVPTGTGDRVGLCTGCNPRGTLPPLLTDQGCWKATQEIGAPLLFGSNVSWMSAQPLYSPVSCLVIPPPLSSLSALSPVFTLSISVFTFFPIQVPQVMCCWRPTRTCPSSAMLGALPPP